MIKEKKLMNVEHRTSNVEHRIKYSACRESFVERSITKRLSEAIPPFVISCGFTRGNTKLRILNLYWAEAEGQHR